MNDFHDDLKFSLDASLEPFWDKVYRKAFVDLERTEICTDLHWQKMGVDRLVYLKGKRIFAVDEKVRRAVWDDVLLEFLSNDRTGAPGWIEKDMAIDWLAYAFLPTQRVYLFSWPMLRRCWVAFGEGWKAKYKIVKAHNPGYRTLSVAVPLPELHKKTATARIIQL